MAFTYNFLTGDESADTSKIKQRRYYNNFYATFSFSKFSLAVEGNYGWQENAQKKDSTKTASLYSGLIVAKYQYIKKSSLYLRGEYLSDPDNVVTGNLSFGNNVMGTTLGLEYKPFKNVAFSVEGRILQSDNLIFRENGYATNQRIETIICIDVTL